MFGAGRGGAGGCVSWTFLVLPTLAIKGSGVQFMTLRGTNAPELLASSPSASVLGVAPPSPRVFLISCGRQKLAAAAPVRDLYTSSRFRSACRLAEEVNAPYFVVSAKYGLVPPYKVVEPYELALCDMLPAAVQEWARSVADQLWQMGNSTSVVLLARDEYARSVRDALQEKGISVIAPVADSTARDEFRWIADARRVALRGQHLRSIYGLLSQAIERGDSFLLAELSTRSLPRKGVYIFLDDAELNFLGDCPRIVRIGTHGVSAGSKSTLRNRLRNHLGTAEGGGNHRGSIFRLHVGQALLTRDGRHRDFPSWGSGQDAPLEVRGSESVLEREVGQYLRRLRVVVIELDDPSSKKSLRAYVESNLIALLTEGGAPLDVPNPNWLGKWADADAIRSSGLWNVRDVGRRYDARAISLLLDRLSFRATLV